MIIVDEDMDLNTKDAASQTDPSPKVFKETAKNLAGSFPTEITQCLNEGARDIEDRLLASDFMASSS